MPSAKVLESKKAIVDELAVKMKNAKSFILADHRGLTVEQDTAMRAAFRKVGIEYKVYKNTLARFAAKANGFEELNPYLEGPTALAFSLTDPIAPAKLLAEYAKKYEKFDLKGGVVEGRVIDAIGVKQVAEIPSKEVLIARLLGAMNSPITGFVNVLNGNIRGLVVALNAIAENKK